MPASASRRLTGKPLADLAFTLTALLRADGHSSNVLTHIASGNWDAIEQAVRAILEPRTSPKKLSSIARNILELLCDDRGVTGRLMRPLFFESIKRIAGKAEMKRLEAKIRRLRHRISADPPARSPDWRQRRLPHHKRISQQIRAYQLPAAAEWVRRANGGHP